MHKDIHHNTIYLDLFFFETNILHLKQPKY